MTGSTRVMSRRTFLRDLGHGAFALTVIGSAGCTAGPTSTRTAPWQLRPADVRGQSRRDRVVLVPERVPSRPPVQGPTRIPRSAALGTHRGRASVWLRPRPGRRGDGRRHRTVVRAGRDRGWADGRRPRLVCCRIRHRDPQAPRSLGRVVHCPRARRGRRRLRGAADIPHIASPRPIVAVGAGDRVMDLAIIPTPGHTPGHIAVHDEAAGVLVVGDAIVYSTTAGVRSASDKRGCSADASIGQHPGRPVLRHVATGAWGSHHRRRLGGIDGIPRRHLRPVPIRPNGLGWAITRRP